MPLTDMQKPKTAEYILGEFRGISDGIKTVTFRKCIEVQCRANGLYSDFLLGNYFKIIPEQR